MFSNLDLFMAPNVKDQLLLSLSLYKECIPLCMFLENNFIICLYIKALATEMDATPGPSMSKSTTLSRLLTEQQITELVNDSDG